MDLICKEVGRFSKASISFNELQIRLSQILR